MSTVEEPARTATVFALTSAQLGIWNAQRLEPESPYYVVGDVVQIRGSEPVDLARLAEAMVGTVGDAESLRLRFAETPDGPRQWVCDDPVAEPRVFDVSGEVDPVAAAEALVRRERFATAEACRGMVDRPLFSQVIIRLSECEVWYTQLGHHLLFDGYSAAMLARRTAARYTAAVRGEDPPPSSFSPFAEFVRADREYRDSDRPERDRAYWVDRLTPLPEVGEWTSGASGAPSATVSAETVVSAEEFGLLRKFADELNVTWGDVVLASYAAFLHRVLGHTDVVFALPLMCRTSAAELRTPGMAVNVLPLRVEVRSGDRLDVLAPRVAQAMRELRAHQRYRGEDLPRDLAVPGAGALLHGCGVNLKAFDLALDFAGATGTMRNVAGGPPEDMGLSVLPTRDGGLLLGFEVDAATHDQEAVDERLAAMHRLLTELPGAARPAVGQVELLTPQRRRNLLDAWTPPAPAGTPLDPGALLDELATTCGDATALVHGDSRLSYADLAARVHRLARALRARGVGAEDVVALALPRSVDMVVALLAVLDAGAAFLPLDPEHPVERLRALTADARPALLLTTRDDALPTASVPRLDLDDPGFVAECSNLPEGPLAEHELSEPRRGERLAYVIYTSGSTGTPKGVQVPVAALRALLHHHRSTLVAETARGRRLRVAHTYSFAFDSSLDQLSWLLCGHELHVYDVEVAKDVDALLAAYAADRIDVVDTTPSLAAPLVDAGLLDGAHPLSLLILGGEATPPALWRRVVASGVRARNMYGPTEATVDSIGAVLDGDEPVIGHPLAGVRVYLLDTALQPVGPGGVGELYLAGPQLARGYLNRPGVTAERFVADPFAPEPGARMYRTGDLARWAPGRGFLYLGRADGQVKIRGHRVELGEVEAALGALPEVSAAAAVVRHETGSPRLVGYVVAERGADLAPDAVREALADRLPDHLVPAAVVVLDALPRTVNGKLDRAALPVPRTARGGRPPATERERVLCRVVAEVFGLDEVGPDDDFFSFGGDSISAITVSSRLRAAGFELRPRDLLARRDLGTLARRLVERTDETATVVDEPVGPVPAPPIVRALFDAHDDPSAVAGYAQWTAVTVTSPPTVGELVAGVRTVLDRHAALRLRWAPSAELEVLPADAVDASAMVEQVDLAECTDDALATLADRLAADLDPSTGAVLRVALVLAPGAMRVLVLAHHLVVDGVSWRVLVPDLREACLAAREGRPAALPSGTPGTSWRRHATVLAEQGRTGARRSELDHWRAAADPACRPLGCAPLDPALDTAATAQRSVTVADCTASDAVLTALPAAYRAGPDEVLLAALALALRSWRGARDALSITVERHGRDAQEPGADLSRTVGWFTSEFPVRVPADAIHTDADLRDALAGGDAAGRLLRAVKEARRAVPGSGIGYGVLRHLDTDTAGELGSAPEVVLNYLGRFTSPEDGDWTLPSGDAFAVVEPEAKALEQVLALNCFVHEDGPSPRLAVEWTAARRLLDETAVRELQQAWQSALTALATHAARLGPDGGGLTPSDLPLVRLEQSDIDALERRGRVVEVFHATPLQVGLSFHTLTRDTDDTDVYVVQAVLSLSGELDRERLADAARELLRRQPALRVHLATTAAGETVQVVPAEVTLDWTVEDLPAEQDVEASFAASCRSELDRPFDPEVPPLLRFRLCTLGPREHRLVLTNHHALLDGWSMPLVGRTLLGLYAELGGGPAVPAPPPLSAYHQWLAERDRDAALTAWREALAGVDEGTRLAPATARPRLDRPERVTVDLGEDFSDRLRAFARDHGITVTTVLQTAWGLLLGRLTRRRDVVFGCPVSGRPAEVDGVESMVGQLGNTIPVRVRFDPRQRVGEVLARVHEESVALTEHHHLGLPDIQRAVGVGELFDTMLVMENFPFSGRGAMPVVPGLELAGVRITDATHYPLTVVVIPEDEITIGLGYQPHVFDEDTVRAYGRWLHTILREIVADVDRPVGRVPMLDTEETERMLRLGTGPSTRRRDAFLTEFARWVARKPDAEAVVCRDRRLTYAELDRLANRLAHALLAAGVGQEDPVGVLLGRDVEMIVALFGVLKAGAVYLPLDPNYPAERLAYMVGDARPAAFVTDADALDVLGGAVPGDPTAPVLRVDAPEVLGDPAVPERDTDPAHARAGLSEDSLAYVIYTSGTTGKPKGVAVTHRGIPDLVSLQEDVVGVTEHDRYLHFASTSFDVAFWQTMVPLCSGGTLVVAPEEVRVPGDELLDYIVEHRVTGVNLLPSFLAAMPEDRTVDDDVFFVVGAERLDPELARRWGEGRRALFNAYGPTEVTINSVTWRYQPGESGAAPIGRPDPNVTAYVLDDALQPVGVGVIGELYLGGPKLARGYLGLPGRTAQAFVADPFVGVPGARMYRTGDLVYWRADGQLVFVGRADRQVKIRGFRIELGEIESALSRHPDVRGCAVVVREDRERRLVGYVIPAEGARFDPARLREDLLTELPDHLVPTAFVALDRLPLTPGGKLDEAALPAPERGPARPAREPATRAEEVLLRLVRELVGTDDVTLDDRFLEIGGDSIVSLQLVSRARRHGLHLRPRDVLDGATIAGIAARCVEPDAAADTAVADTTAVVTGDAPLTPVMLDLLRRCADTPGGVDTARDFCQWTELCVPAGGSAEVWREVLDALLARHDVLRAHLARGDGEPVLRIPAPGAVTAAAVLTHVVAQPGEDVRERVDVWLADARAALDLWNGPLLRAMWVDRGADDLGRLVLLAHHLLVDGVSWRIVVDELAELYAAVVAGAPVPSPPARGTSFLGWARALRSAAPGRHAELPHWTRVVDGLDAPPLSDVALDPARDTAATAVHHEIRVAPDLTRALLTTIPAAFHTTPDAVLLTAFLRAVGRWRERTPELVMALESHGRPTHGPEGEVDLSRTVGWFTAVYPAHLRVPGESSAAAVKAVKEQLRAHGDGLGHGILTAAGEPDLVAAPRPQVSWNYLGQFPAAPKTEIPWQAPPGATPFGSGGETLPLPYGLMVDAMAWDDGDGTALRARLTWPRALFTDDDVAALGEEFHQQLVALAGDPELLAGAGHTPSDFPSVTLDQAAVEELERRYAVVDVLPLSPLQQLMLHHTRASVGGCDPYTVQATFSLVAEPGEIDVRALHAAVADLVARHPNLGAAFPDAPGLDAVQVLVADAAPDCRLVDLSHLVGEEQQRAVEDVLERDFAERFDLAAGAPIRLTVVRRAANRAELVLTSHHVLSDGWSAPRMLAEIFAAYTARTTGTAPTWPAPVPFTRYLSWLAERDRDADLTVWQRALAGLGEGDYLVGAELEPGAGHPAPVLFDVDAELVARLTERAAERGLTVGTLVQGAWAAVLAVWSGRTDVCFGTMVSGRTPDVDGVEHVIGLLANTVPVRVRLDGTTAEAFAAVQSRAHDLDGHHAVALSDLERVTGLRRLFDSLLVFENYPVDPAALAEPAEGLRVVGTRFREFTHHPVTVTLVPEDGGWHGVLARRHGALTEADAEALALALQEALRGLASAEMLDADVAVLLGRCERAVRTR